MTTQTHIKKLSAYRLRHQAGKKSYFVKNPAQILEHIDSDSSSDDESGAIAGPTAHTNATINGLSNYGLFSATRKKTEKFFNPQHKLTAAERELLNELLELLGFNENEFKLKLQENHMPLKMFLNDLKKAMQHLQIPSPKDFPELCLRRLLEEKLLPQFLLEKPLLQEKLLQIELEKNARFRPTPFSMRPRPPAGKSFS